MKPLFFCGSSNRHLGDEISSLLNIHPGRMNLGQFPDGESFVEILEPVRGKQVFILQSIAMNPNFYLMELLVIIDALKRASAKEIITVIPYLGYCRQDRKDKPGLPISAKLVADLISTAGATRVITFDLHAGQLEGFFSIPVDHLHCQNLLAKEAQSLLGENSIVVAPDIGSVKIAEKMASCLGSELAIIEKQRQSAFEVKASLIGHVDGKDVLIVDDICSTGGTLVAAANLCKAQGARKVIAAVSHGIFTADAIEKIEGSELSSIMSTNTVPSLNRFSNFYKLKTVSIASLIVEGIENCLWH